VDVDPRTYNLDPEKLKLALEAAHGGNPRAYPLPRPVHEADPPLRPRAVISVDLFGIPADYHRLTPVCRDAGLVLIEDAAQSFGASLNGRPAGSFGDAGCTSFFPAKPLGGYGDGGAVLTHDRNLAEELRSVRVHGQGETKYLNRRIGLNARMDTLQAAMLLPKLDIFPDELERRKQVAQAYFRGLAQIGPGLTLPHVPTGCRPAWAQFSIRVRDRDSLQQHLKEHGIPSAVYYQCPLHLQEAFAGLGYGQGDMPVSERLAGEICSLPMHPYLPLDHLQQIVDIIGCWIQKRS
jgi:dTDP-4-amino-4,6-dideoxygalactose transaminase